MAVVRINHRIAHITHTTQLDYPPASVMTFKVVWDLDFRIGTRE